jgi:hypothetical protein
MKAPFLTIPGILLMLLNPAFSAAQEPDWRSPGFKFGAPVELVVTIPMKETRQKPGDTGGLPPSGPNGGFVGQVEFFKPGAVLGSITASNGDTLSCVVAGPKEAPTSKITVSVNAMLGMRGYRIKGPTIEFRTGFEARPRIKNSGNLPEQCRARFKEEVAAALERLVSELEKPAGAFPLETFFAEAEDGKPATLPVALKFLRTEKTVTLTFPRPRPFGQ